jgi:hypothetical protein
MAKRCVSISVVSDVSDLEKIVAGSSPESRQLQTDLQGVIGQKTELLKHTDVRTSNLTTLISADFPQLSQE